MLLRDNLDKIVSNTWYIVYSNKDYVRYYAMAYRKYNTHSPDDLVFRYVTATGLLSENPVEWIIKTYPEIQVMKLNKIEIDLKSDYSLVQIKSLTTDLDRK